MEESNYQPSEVELEILQILWEHQPATVRFIHEKICERREVRYTTILTFLRRMANEDNNLEKKQIVERYKVGKTHYYKALLKETDVQQTLFQKLVNTAYKGSPMKMVMHALGQSEVSSEELEKLQAWLEAKKREDND